MIAGKFALLVLGLLGNPQAPPDRMALVAEFRASQKAVGIAVAVITRRSVWHCEAGYADLAAKTPVSVDTLFRLGSVSKPVAAVAVMQQVQKGKLDLDKGVTAYVPGFDDRNGAISLRRVLSHTAGIRHYKPEGESFFTPMTTQQALDLWAKDPLVAPPGEKYSYSTHALTLAVAAVEKASGRSYVDYVRQAIAATRCPSLDCEVLADAKPNRSRLYQLRQGEPVESKPRQDNSWKYGGGGIESSAVDLAKFGKGVLDAKLVSGQSRDAMWTRQVLADGKSIAYGLG